MLETQAEFFSPNQPDGVHYDYEVDADALSAFTHLDWAITEHWQADAGIRLEETQYDYQNLTDDGPACSPSASASC